MLPWGALPGSTQGKYLVDELAICVLPSPQMLPDIIHPTASQKKFEADLIIVGDVDFDSADAQKLTATDLDDQSTDKKSNENGAEVVLAHLASP